MKTTILGLIIGPGFLNQVPTLGFRVEGFRLYVCWALGISMPGSARLEAQLSSELMSACYVVLGPKA